MSRPFTVEAVRPAELEAALRFLFQHLPPDEQRLRTSNALRMIQTGDLNPEGVLAAHGPEGLLGAMVCLPVPGASGLVWPPQTVGGDMQRDIEDSLVRHACAWLQQRGAKLGQALLVAEETSLAAPLERNGFAHITELWYLRHDLQLSADILLADERLTYQTYQAGNRDLFHATLLRSYEGTLDCPEVNQVRDLDEVITGHQAQGQYDADHWWLALDRGQPAAVLITALLPEAGAWDVAYVGVVPEARRCGWGREVMRKALLEARAAEATQVTLTVDNRNDPAWNLYMGMDFQTYDRREVYLAIWR